jgi:3-oxoadipate enol-lactonase
MPRARRHARCADHRFMPSIDIRGFDCYYDYRETKPGAPVVLFLNGIMSGVESWNHAAQTAQQLGFNTLCYEYRGQWRSQVTPGPYTMQQHRDDLSALLDALHIEKAHFVGTSYGGMVAMPYAAMHPSRVASLVVIATTARIRPESYAIVKGWRDLSAEGDVEKLFVGMMPHLYSPRTLRDNPELAEKRVRGLKRALADFPDFCHGQVLLHDAHYLEMLDEGVTALLGEIQCKTLVVSAELDLLYPPSDSAYMAQRISGAEHVIVADAAHAVVAERPAIVSTLMAGHLSTYDTSSR